MRQTLLIAGILGIALCGVAGCVSRTLPLPPPEVASVSSPTAQGLVTIKGFCLEGATIGIVNNRTAQGTIVTSPAKGCNNACPWQATLPGRVHDTFRVWQFFASEGAYEAQVPRATESQVPPAPDAGGDDAGL